MFIYLSKVHVQYACTNFLLGEPELLSGAWRLTIPAAAAAMEVEEEVKVKEEGGRSRLKV